MLPIRPRTMVPLSVAMGMLALSTACITSDITQVTRATAPVDTSGGPTIQRGSISLAVSIDTADAATASAVGLRRSGLTVTLTRDGGTEPPRTAVTDAEGAVRFGQLLQGRYVASVTRSLSAAERALLPSGDADATIFAGGASIFLAAGQNDTRALSLVAARRGSIIISELFNGNAGPVSYGLGDYIEFYNNGDTTVYLDGMLFARSRGYHTSNPNSASCETSAILRLDPTRYWALQIWTFPGSGRDFPVLPGRAKVLAMDALDHRAASGQPYYADLSRAEFEQFMSEADTDNPFAANMINAPLVNGTGIFGRGYTWNNDASMVIALPTPVSQLTTGTYVGTQAIYMGIPAERVLDVFSYGNPFNPAFPDLSRPCPQWIHPVFDRGHYDNHRTENRVAIRRRSLGFLDDGREILQRTRNSARDIETAPSLLLRSLERR
jgi:hypothetical protein